MGERQAAEAAAGLRARALHEVEAGGYAWRIRRVGQRELAAVKHVSLMVLSRDALVAPTAATIEEQADRIVATARRLAPSDVAKLRDADVALVAASLVAFRELPDGAWIPCRVTTDDDPPPVDDEGRALLPIRDLPEGVEALLASEAAAWAAGGADGVAALRAFRNGAAGGATPPAPAGEGVRDEAVDPVAGG